MFNLLFSSFFNFCQYLNSIPITIFVISALLFSSYFFLFYKKKQSTQLYSLSLLLCLILFIYLILSALLYCFSAQFLDHSPPSIAMSSFKLYQGYSIYPLPETGFITSLLYGPTTYIVNGLISSLSLFDTVPSVKLSGIFLCFSSIGLFFYTLYCNFSFKKAVFGLLFYLVIGLNFYTYLYWIRPDSLIFFSCILFCYSFFCKRPILFIILSALAISLSINAKFISFLYFIPFLPLVIKRHGTKYTSYVIILSIIFTGLPFIIPSISLSNYIFWILAASNHDISLYIALIKTGPYALILFSPVLVLFMRFLLIVLKSRNIKSPLFNSYHLSIFLYLICLLIAALLATKAGSNNNQIIYFTPSIIIFFYLYLSFIQSHSLSQKNISFFYPYLLSTSIIPLFFSFFLCMPWIQLSVINILVHDYLPSFMSRFQNTITHQKYKHKVSGFDVIKNLKSIQNKYPNASIMMGYSGDQDYRYSFFRVLLLTDIHLYFLDTFALNDYKASGIPIPIQTIQKFEHEIYDIILIPGQEQPFSMTSMYSRKDLFSDLLRTTFKQHYIFVKQSKFYQIWISRNYLENQSKPLDLSLTL